jgi:hypothetical protein
MPDSVVIDPLVDVVEPAPHNRRIWPLGNTF